MSAMTNHLNLLLADTYALYLKTQNYHWNVEGESFFFIHQALETQYEALATAVDDIAERLRALGEKVEASFDHFAKKKTLTDGDSHFTAKQMLQDLHQDHLKIATALQQALTQTGDDAVSEDMLVNRITWHQKTAWMLASNLQS